MNNPPTAANQIATKPANPPAKQPADPAEPTGLSATIFSPSAELSSALSAAVLLLSGWGVAWFADKGSTFATFGAALIWGALAIGMVYGGKAALDSLREGKFDIDVLMIVGAVLAAFIGAPAEGALLLMLFSISGALEELAMAKTKRAIEALHALMPTKAQRFDEVSQKWIEVPPESLVAGDWVRVASGELIPADANVRTGSTAIDQATLTGESMPREVKEGDEVYAGTLNTANPIDITVVRPASESSLAKIVDLVTKAQQQRQPLQRIIDKISQPYAIGVCIGSLVVLLIWHFALGVAWLGSENEHGRGGAIYTAITFLIVCSPCALIIATPTATLAAISRAARGGVLFKGGQAIERLSKLSAIAFDKTGTLTVGKPAVLDVQAVAWSDGTELLAVAAGLEMHSTHPIARAIVEYARVKGVTPRELHDVKDVVGRGITGNPGDPRIEARLGSLAHTLDVIPECLRNKVREVLASVQTQGQIAVVCATGPVRGTGPCDSTSAGQAAVFILADRVRPGADVLVERLHALGVKPVVMLTGDNELTAATVARSLGLDAFHAQLLPQDKVRHVSRMKRELHETRTGHIGVIGDGANDAPALSAADVSIAIGSIGSDVALESADIVLLSDDLAAVPWCIGLARSARRKILINLTLSLAAIAIMATFVLTSRLTGISMPLWVGVLGHEGGTLLVVGNSLLLLAYRASEPHGPASAKALGAAPVK